jgi:CRP/FNR family transcriptional regulator, nitrogen fixation regulation protein
MSATLASPTAGALANSLASAACVPRFTELYDGSRGLKALPAQSFSADSEIYAEGDAAVMFYKLVNGMVRSCKFLSDGRRQIDAFYVAGDIFGFEAGAEYGLSAEAVSDCTVIAYRRRGLEFLATNEDGMALQLFSYAMRCLERAREHSLLLGRCSATQKLAGFLTEMLQRSPGGDTIVLPMSRRDIADYLGLTIETVSRTLSRFERDGVIAFSRARCIYLKNCAALRNLNG